MVILLRSPGGDADVMAAELGKMGIPAHAISRTGYFSTQEIQVLLNYLAILDNPRQDIPLVGVMSSAMFGFSDDELAMIKSENSYISFFDNVTAYADNGEDETLVLKVKSFLDTLSIGSYIIKK